LLLSGCFVSGQLSSGNCPIAEVATDIENACRIPWLKSLNFIQILLPIIFVIHIFKKSVLIHVFYWPHCFCDEYVDAAYFMSVLHILCEINHACCWGTVQFGDGVVCETELEWHGQRKGEIIIERWSVAEHVFHWSACNSKQENSVLYVTAAEPQWKRVSVCFCLIIYLSCWSFPEKNEIEELFIVTVSFCVFTTRNICNNNSGVWTFHTIDYSYHGLFVPRVDYSYHRLLYHGLFVP